MWMIGLITAKLDSGAIGTIEVSRTAVGAEGIRGRYMAIKDQFMFGKSSLSNV